MLAFGPAAFHCRQAAEKTLKAFLIWRSVPLDRVHNLVYQSDLCEMEEPGFASLREETERLTPYAVEIRYPGDLLLITPEEARPGACCCASGLGLCPHACAAGSMARNDRRGISVNLLVRLLRQAEATREEWDAAA